MTEGVRMDESQEAKKSTEAPGEELTLEDFAGLEDGEMTDEERRALELSFPENADEVEPLIAKNILALRAMMRLIENGRTQKAIERSISYIDEGNGLTLIDLHPNTPELSDYGEGLTPIIDGTANAWLRAGHYFLISIEDLGRFKEVAASVGIDTDKGIELLRKAPDGMSELLLATDPEQVGDEGLTPEPIQLEMPDGSKGKFGSTLNLWAIKMNESGRYVSMLDVRSGISTSAALQSFIRAGKRIDEDAKKNSITSELIKRVYFATDKVTENVYGTWNDRTPDQIEKMLSDDGLIARMGIDLANKADKERGIQRVAQLKLDWDELPEEVTISGRNKLTEYDKRVYEAILSLLYGIDGRKSHVYSVTEIYHAMGGKGKPNTRAMKKINDSITRLMKTSIEVDNASEAEAYTKYEHFKYDGALLPVERVTGYVDGQPSGSLVHVFREPPLATFAMSRKQISSCDLKVLQTPVNQTDMNMRIEDYMRRQIAWMKNGKSRNRKMTYDAIFNAADISNRQAKARKKKDVRKILDHWEGIGFIRGFEEDAKGVTIKL